MDMFLANGKITFNQSGSGSVSGRLNIPVNILKFLNIDKNDRDIEFIIKDDALVIQKKPSATKQQF